MLDAAELEAIRSAIGEALRGSSAPTQSAAREATPIPLIADDRAAETARPSGLKLAGRWAITAARRIARLTGARLEIDVSGVEIVEGEAIKEEFASNWSRCFEVSGRRGYAMVAAAGPLIEALATCLLGGTPDEVQEDHEPSATSLRLFGPVGEAVVSSLMDVWQEEQSCTSRLVEDGARVDGWRRSLGDADVVVLITLTASGPTRGTFKMIARPETLVAPPAPVEAVRVPPGAIEEALGAVPIEVRVELGRARMTMADFAELGPGDVIPLDQFVDDLLPVQCNGIVKGFGRALVSRGVMAVEVSEIADQRATHSKAA